jgi:hypothetical protein
MNLNAFWAANDRAQDAGGDPRRRAGLWADEKAASAESDMEGCRDFEDESSGQSQFNLNSILGEKIRSIRNDLDAG